MIAACLPPREVTRPKAPYGILVTNPATLYGFPN
jgi:hypothetical protein